MINTDTHLEPQPVTSNAVPLTQLTRGQSGRVICTEADPEDCSMLRAMGLRPDANIQMCSLGEPCIVSLSGACGGGCRIGLAKDIASRVMIQVDTPNDDSISK